MDNVDNYLNSMVKMAQMMNQMSLDRFQTLLRCDHIGNHLVLDVGCGDGSWTVEVLKPFLGSNVQIEASDLYETMIEHAIHKHGYQGVKFFVWDILAEVPVRDMVSRYDHVYSFLCFHYCQDLRKVIKNVYNVLKPGGTLFFTMMAKLPFYEAFKKLSRYPAWAPYLNDLAISQYSAPLQFEENPDTCCIKLMREGGFKDVHAEFGVGGMIMDSWDHFTGLSRFGDRFEHTLPEELREQYMRDYLAEMKAVEGFVSEKVNADGKTYIEINDHVYRYIICYGIKSDNK